MMMNKQILPQGDNIRQLLVKSNITEASVNAFLKEKGVFLGSTEKNNSVPLLMKTIVSPHDFENLYEIQKNREENYKHRTASINCERNFKLTDIFNDPINLNQAIIDRHTYRPDYKIVGNPNFYFEGPESAIFEYKVERENALNDWTTNKTYHHGSLRIDKDTSGVIHISVQQNSTSKETQEVNSILLSYIKEKLNSESLIKKDDSFISIRFNDFNNTNRIKFLYSFAKNLSIYTKFISLTDINLYLGPAVAGHADLENFLAEIENLKLRGKSLHNHVFIKSDKYHEKLLIASINLKYELSINGVEGIMYLYLSFPDYIKNRNTYSEFQTEIKFSFGNIKRRSSMESDIRKKMLVLIENIKMNKFDKYKI